LGKFYFDKDTWEVTIQAEKDGVVYHEHRCGARTLIQKLAESIAEISMIV